MSNAEQNAQDAEAVELSIAQAKLKITRMEKMNRLEQNADFQELILDGFMGEHAVRQVFLRASPHGQNEAVQKMIDSQIAAVGGLKQFFISIEVEGREAKKALAADELTQEEIAAEGLN